MIQQKSDLDIETYKWVRDASFEEIRTEVDNLRDFRIIKGIKQGGIAKILNCYQSQVSALENDNGVMSKRFTSRYISVMRKIMSNY